MTTPSTAQHCLRPCRANGEAGCIDMHTMKWSHDITWMITWYIYIYVYIYYCTQVRWWRGALRMALNAWFLHSEIVSHSISLLLLDWAFGSGPPPTWRWRPQARRASAEWWQGHNRRVRAKNLTHFFAPNLSKSSLVGPENTSWSVKIIRSEGFGPTVLRERERHIYIIFIYIWQMMFGVACVLSPLRKALAQTSEVWARSRPQTSNAILFRCGRCADA